MAKTRGVLTVWNIAAVLIALGGLGGVGYQCSEIERQADEFATFTMPGSETVSLPAGDYVIYYASQLGDHINLMCAMSDEEGSQVPLDNDSDAAQIEMLGPKWVPVKDITIDRTGEYTMECELPEKDGAAAKIAIGKALDRDVHLFGLFLIGGMILSGLVGWYGSRVTSKKHRLCEEKCNEVDSKPAKDPASNEID